ncbi:Tetratricopeptide repeat protein [uncultured archaeon]|nr:Tetratricopeptide repeat protein [uncultured archaeon]
MKLNLAIGLGNYAYFKVLIGELEDAESNYILSQKICREINNEFWKAVNHGELGKIYAFKGRFKESEKEIAISINLFIKLDEIRSQGIPWAYHSIRDLLRFKAYEALNFAQKSRELADAEKNEMDIIEAEYLLGAAHLMKGNLPEAEKHLNEALIRDRKSNYVEFEPDILLELAKLRFNQKGKHEASKFAEEALQIADRCEYRLKQADIHNFLSEFYLDTGDIAKAREHGEIAKERAACGYVPAMEKAERLLKEIDSKGKVTP